MRTLRSLHHDLVAAVIPEEDEKKVRKLTRQLHKLHPRETELRIIEAELSVYEATFLRDILDDLFLFDIGNIQALAVYNLVFTAPYLRALAGGARRSNYTKWQNKSGAKAIWRQTIKSGA